MLCNIGNRVGLPQTALPTFLSFPHFDAFKNGGPMDDLSSMEKPNANEREWAMGFCTSTTTMQGIFKEPIGGF